MHKEVKRPPRVAACKSFNLVYEFYGCQRFSQKTTVLNQITPLYVILSGEKRLRFAESKFCGSSEASKQKPKKHFVFSRDMAWSLGGLS